MYYVASKNIYIDWHGTYTDEELDYFSDMESEWRKTLPNYSFNELLTIFPEAKPVIKKKLKEAIVADQQDLEKAELLEKKIDNIIYTKCRSNEKLWKMILIEMFVEPLRRGKEQRIKRNLWRLESNPPNKNLDVPRAKEFPIPELMDFNRGRALCLWHKEKTPSMYYYLKSNRVKCYGCGKNADSIDVYMQLYGVDFIEAVKKLSL